MLVVGMNCATHSVSLTRHHGPHKWTIVTRSKCGEFGRMELALEALYICVHHIRCVYIHCVKAVDIASIFICAMRVMCISVCVCRFYYTSI